MQKLSSRTHNETRVKLSREMAIKRSLFALLVAMWCLPSLTVTAWAQLKQPSGRHFIVLVDDSGSFRDKRNALKNYLPNLLFDGLGERGLEVFQEGQDTLSVLFFTIYKSGTGCGQQRAMSALPEDVFYHEFTGRIKKTEFTDNLTRWLSRPCRVGGNWSPIGISSMLVLPYLQSKLSPGEIYSQTILIEITDGKFNTLSPSHELIEYGVVGIKNTGPASETIDQVSKFFRLDVPSRRRIFKNGVFYLVAEIKPQYPPESAIQYQQDSTLHPQAVSQSELGYSLNDQVPGDIRILPPGKEAKFTPLWLRVGFQSADGKQWAIGGKSLPNEAPQQDLIDCKSPVCVEREGGRYISLFDAAVGRLSVSPSAPEPEPGRVSFQVGFHYDTPVYNHLCAETPPLTINVDKARWAQIPNLFLPATTLTGRDVVAEWTEDNGGVTTQEMAKNRILARRNLRWLMIVIVAVILAIFVMVYLFLKYYHRRFLPQLKWLAVPEVVVDFNRPAASRLLVGTLKVENNQPVPWLGDKLGNEEQPTRQAEISLGYNFFQKSGLELAGDNPIGFVHGEKAVTRREELDRTVQEAVSDGKQIYVFLAADMIRDYQTSGASGRDAHFNIKLDAQMKWGVPGHTGNGWSSPVNRLRTRLVGERPGGIHEEIQCRLTVKPEEPRKPLVTYKGVGGTKIYFKKRTWVQVGSFWFESRALHRFAQPYEWEGYTIQTYQGNRPLSGEPISFRLDKPRVTVPSDGLPVEMPVYLYCDGQTIPNPDPASCEYIFKLIGDFDAESKPGPYTTTLYRDPTRAEIELKLIQPKLQLEVYWTSGGVMKLCTLPDGVDAGRLLQDPATVRLDPQTIKFDVNNARARDLLSFEVGNSGNAGRGEVTVEIIARIRCEPAVKNSIKIADSRPLEDLLGVYTRDVLQPQITVREGDKAQSRAVRIHPGYISRIDSGRIEAGKLAAEINLAIRVSDDQGKESQRAMTILIPLTLEQLPGLNWLAIDFGTSAIAAALGTGRADGVMMIPLQEITVKGGRSFSEYDIWNAERGNRYLLPSWVSVDADLRNKSGDRQRPGFPGYFSEELSLTPGKADFVGLPAVTQYFVTQPDRIIYSLKSWLGKSARSIHLPKKIEFMENGEKVSKDTLPLDKVVESGFAALAEAYLLVEPDYRADQIVICHPNTFTRRHQELLHGIAQRALSKPERPLGEPERGFGIPLPERIRLISESDAVAYHYCATQMRGQPRKGTERILVYDFGAGTLDLSLIRVEWKENPPRYPVEWKVERRVGVPVAGNYIDEILARLIDRLLRDPEVIGSGRFRYRLPVVGRSLDKEAGDMHRRAIVNLWNWIREAKHAWSRECRELMPKSGRRAELPPFKVKVGEVGGLGIVEAVKAPTKVNGPGQVGEDGGLSIVEPTAIEAPEEEQEKDEGLWIAGSNIYLSIPSRWIHEDKRMSEFIKFVTQDVIDELLNAAKVKAGSVDTLIVSGRGALYPALRERVGDHFPGAEKPDLLAGEAMKEAVVLGAIARQDLKGISEDTSDEVELAPKFGVLINHDEDLVLDEDWDEPIDLARSPTFRLVQVNLQNPNPRKDMKSLRRHFYIDLADPYYRRDDILGDGKQLYVRKEIKDGKLDLYLEGKDSANSTPVFAEVQVAESATTPPWPVGNVLLDPLD